LTEKGFKMAEYTIVGIAASRAARNIWMLEELGVPYAHDPIHYKDAGLKQAPYTDWNPNGAIPILLVGKGKAQRAIYESLAINMYLAGKHRKFCGSSSEDGGECAQWSLWAATALEPIIGQWSYHTMFLPEPERKPELAAEALNKLHTPLKILEGVLSKSSCLVGKSFTVADLNVAAVAFRVLSTPIANQYPATKAWIEKCWARPAAIKVRRMRGEQV
jgi:glutathione S-transferase